MLATLPFILFLVLNKRLHVFTEVFVYLLKFAVIITIFAGELQAHHHVESWNLHPGVYGHSYCFV